MSDDNLDPVIAVSRSLLEKQQIQQTRSNVEPTEVFEIPEDKCGLVIGKGGSKIQEIRSTAGVDVNLGDRDSAVNGMMKVYLWGDKEGCDKAKKIIVDIISEPSVEFEIPEDKCGVVIGKRGSKIKEIRSETGVRVNVRSRDSAVNGMIKVTLKGDKQGCDEAKNIILELISEQTEVFEIPEDRSGQVIGERGSKVKEIESKTGVRVNVRSSKSAVNGMIKVTLMGNKEGCDEAKTIIMDLISQPTEVFEIPKDRSGQVIGERGSKVKEIESKTGVRVNVRSSKSAVNGMIKVTLMGNKEGCDEARTIIMDLISQPTEVFEIPVDMIGVLIGKGGSKIQEIQSETGFRVNVGSRDSAVNGMIKVTLHGKQEECNEAKMIIMNIISGPTEVFKIPEYMIGVVKGSKIQEIQSETGVEAILGSRDSAVRGMVKVTLMGNKQGCEEAKRIIMDLISEPTEVFEIPEDTIDFVIGHREFKLQEIHTETGVKVNFGACDPAVDSMFKITLWGAKKDCDEAKKIIMELISEPTVVFEIPDDMVGVVIGKRGSKVREIKSETGVRVSVQSIYSAVDGMIEVRLWGNKLECTEVESIIMELISETYQYQNYQYQLRS